MRSAQTGPSAVLVYGNFNVRNQISTISAIEVENVSTHAVNIPGMKTDGVMDISNVFTAYKLATNTILGQLVLLPLIEFI